MSAQAGTTVWDEICPAAARRLLLAALESFATVGYHATTTRDIASRAGLSPAAVYVHYASKEQVLQTISRIGHESALRAFEEGLASGTEPVERISNAVNTFTVWHAENQQLARVITIELESLPGEGQREIRELRSRFERALRHEIEEGIAAGVFAVDDVPGTATAIFSFCIDVARWYSPTGRRRPHEIGALYADLSIRMIRR